MPNIRTKLELRQALVRCHDFFVSHAERRDVPLVVRAEMDILKVVCFEALEKPTEGGLKSLREGMR